jgi:hypothetical protein
MLVDQNVLGTDKGVDYLLALVTDDALREKCKEIITKLPDSVSKWKKFTKQVEDHNKEESKVHMFKKKSVGITLIKQVNLNLIAANLNCSCTFYLLNMKNRQNKPLLGLLCKPDLIILISNF